LFPAPSRAENAKNRPRSALKQIACQTVVRKVGLVYSPREPIIPVMENPRGRAKEKGEN
jgi:hypothetical protein